MESGAMNHRGPSRPSRRAFLGAAGVAAASMATLPAFGAGATNTAAVPSASSSPAGSTPQDTYETHAKGIRILPGHWRSHYAWEHIAWVSPAWPNQDYIWLDFPEAIFTSQGLLFLSHVNPTIATVFSDLPPVPWQRADGGVSFDWELPNGVTFGGTLRKETDTVVGLELRIRNGSPERLTDITLQTCAYLRAIREFADYTRDNKFVHVKGSGWVPLPKALELADGDAPYRVGWRTKGKRVADVPMVVTVSNHGERLMAFTWGKDTLSMIGNPHHPCVHADPKFADLEPGGMGVVRGRLVFFEGPLSEFDYEDHLELEA